MRFLLPFSVAAASFAAAFCTSEPPPAAALIVLDGATNVRSERGFGDSGVEYDLPAGDAHAAIAEIHRRLGAQGWQPAAELWDLRQPGSSSFTAGWRCFPVSLQRPQEGVRYQWTSDWRNAAGDVATYTVGCSTRPPQCARIDVAANLLPSSRIPPDGPVQNVSGAPNVAIAPECDDLRRELERRQREAS